MSRNGQPAAGGPPAGLVVDLAPGSGFDRHVHPRHQLAAPDRGSVMLVVEEQTWLLPTTRALWIPAGVPHAVSAPSAATMSSVYVSPKRCPIRWATPTLVAAEGLAGELIRALAGDDLAGGARDRAEALLWDVLEPLAVTDLSLPLPVDERARRLAELVLAEVADDRTLAAWGATVGASARTLARLFTAETGMGFARWRTRARLAAAVPMLADDVPVGTVALQVGYSSPSAFVAAFRRETGTTPTAHFRVRGER